MFLRPPLPPVTPTNQTEFSGPMAKSRRTPHGVKKHLDDDDLTDRTRAWVAQVMNSETFLCGTKEFLKDYGPVDVSQDDVEGCKLHLLDKDILDYDHERLQYFWTAYPVPPSQFGQKERKVFAHLEPIVKAIYDYAASVGKRHNNFSFHPVPDNYLTSSIGGTNHKMDACIVETKNYQGVLTNDNIVVAKEFKNKRSWDGQIEVREQIVGDCHHILSDDPRRMFIYGTTIEDIRMSLWYFSRSHSVKAISFDWTEKDIDIFIQVYLSFAFATPKELGIDPLVHKAPLDLASDNSSEAEQQFIYEFKPNADDSYPQNQLPTSKYYKTLFSYTLDRPCRISGRMTRVWQVIEVDSIHLANEVAGAQPMILKDVWLDVTRKTEAENMDLIFKAVDGFVAEAHERHPSPEGLRHFMMEEKIFEHFDPQTKNRLQNFFTDRHYQSLFLTKLYAWKGETTKERTSNAKPPLKPIFVANARRGTVLSKANSTRLGGSYNTSDLHGTASPLEQVARGLVPVAMANREFAQKQQSLFLYQEVCSSLWDLPSLGDVLDILRQALDVVQVLFCAGWVHRDISLNNILAFPVNEGDEIKWKVKLADLEFAQPHNYALHGSDPRTGTPYFMPWEILKQAHFLEDVRYPSSSDESFADQLNLPGGDENPNYDRFINFRRFCAKTITSLPANATPYIPARNTVVTHNYQHDIESIWWTTMFVVTAGVGHASSFRIQYATTIFKDALGTLREKLRPALQKAFPQVMNDLRRGLYEEYITRGLFGQLALKESYSKIHGAFAIEFDKLLSADVGGWKQTQLVRIDRVRQGGTAKRSLNEDEDDENGLRDNLGSNKRGRLA